ncbi:MAG: zinc ribbon domain-containing protein, partial [bacterium]
MPIYEYRCRKCDAQFEVIQKMGADGRDLVCPDCGQPQPENLISAFSSSSSEGRAANVPC